MSKTTKEDRDKMRDFYGDIRLQRADCRVTMALDDLEAAEAEIARLKKYVAVMDAALKIEDKPQQWRPIETAPKDGSLILGWDNKVMRGKGAECVMLWARNEHTQKHEWMNFWNAYRVDNPCHWMPLPQPPQESESE